MVSKEGDREEEGGRTDGKKRLGRRLANDDPPRLKLARREERSGHVRIHFVSIVNLTLEGDCEDKGRVGGQVGWVLDFVRELDARVG